MSEYEWTEDKTDYGNEQWHCSKHGEWLGTIEYGSGRWEAESLPHWLSSTHLREIVRKLDELNGEAK